MHKRTQASALSPQRQNGLLVYRDKVAIVTGSSSGLGLEQAKLAADKDMRPVLVDIHLPRSRTTRRERRRSH